MVFKKNKEKALALITSRITYFNKIYKYKFKKVSVKKQRTIWGSCSKKGNLNFNYKLIFLPSELSDYIVVHELCHLKEFNHSRKYWSLVEKTIPNYKILRKRARKFVINSDQTYNS